MENNILTVGSIAIDEIHTIKGSRKKEGSEKTN